MKTELLAPQPDAIEKAAGILRAGGLVVIPTETVYGLGADGLNPEAVDKIFAAKGRPGDNPLILHVTGPEQLPRFCHDIPDAAYLLAQRFWPGPLTMVLPANACVPRRTTGGLSTVAIRCPKPPSPGKSSAWPASPSPPPQPTSRGNPPPPQPGTSWTIMTGALTPLWTEAPAR